MTNDNAPADEPLTQAELRLSALHLAAAIHHLHTSIPETLKAIRHAQAGRHPQFGTIENSLQLSREELAKALEILVKDPPNDEQG